MALLKLFQSYHVQGKVIMNGYVQGQPGFVFSLSHESFFLYKRKRNPEVPVVVTVELQWLEH